MNELIKLISSLVETAAAKNYKPSVQPSNIGECIKLLEAGWKIVTYEEIINSDNARIEFHKEGAIKTIILNFADQLKWLELLEKVQGVKR